MLRPSYPISTERLVLRPYAESDFPALCEMFARPEVLRYLYDEPRTPEKDRKSTRLNSSHLRTSRMPSSA